MSNYYVANAESLSLTFDSDGKATLKLKTALPGNVNITFAVDDSALSASTSLTVDSDRGTEIDVSINGSTYQFRSDIIESCSIFAAVYNSSGKMLGVSSTSRSSSASTVNLDIAVADLPSIFTIKVFLVDSSMAPISDALVKEVS